MSATATADRASEVRAISNRPDADGGRQEARAAELLSQHQHEVFVRTDRMFAVLRL